MTVYFVLAGQGPCVTSQRLFTADSGGPFRSTKAVRSVDLFVSSVGPMTASPGGHSSRANACSSTLATSEERLIPRFLASAVTRLSRPCSRLTETRLNPSPTFGLPRFRLALFHCSCSSGVKGRDWSTMNGLSKGFVASASSSGFISKYGLDCILSISLG